MKSRGRTDDNQKEIVSALRRIGCSVTSLAAVGEGMPDILVGTRNRLGVRVNYLMEIKDGSKVESARKLTPDQVTFHNEWRGQVDVVKNFDEALEIATQ